jgi:glycosyltransferase involved in cell wall biosynthesis
MKILITCDRYPGDLSDGLTLRVYNYVKRLKATHSFDLICIDNVASIKSDRDALFSRIIRIPPPVGINEISLIEKVIDAFNPNSLYLYSETFEYAVKELSKNSRYDVIWDAGGNMLRNLSPALSKGIPLLVDQVDDSFLRLGRDIEKASSLYELIWLKKQYLLQRNFSARFIAPADAILFVSQTDSSSFLQEFPRANCVVIENGVDEKYFSAENVNHALDLGTTNVIVFEGSMSFQPNIDAVNYFVKDILPLIKKEKPDSIFLVVGRNPPREIHDMEDNSVRITGTVEDVRPYLCSDYVFVCPMRLGAGIKNKILQAWSMSMAIVSTSAGVGSIEAMDGRDILIRDTPQEFAASVVELLKDGTKKIALGKAGRQNVNENYTWDKKAEELKELMNFMLKDKEIWC